MPSPPGPSQVTINQCNEADHDHQVEYDQSTDSSNLLPKQHPPNNHCQEEEKEATDRATLFQSAHHLPEAEEEEATVNLLITKQPDGQKSNLATVHLVVGEKQQERGLSSAAAAAAAAANVLLPEKTTTNQLRPTASLAVKLTNNNSSKQSTTTKLTRRQESGDVNTVTYLLPAAAAETVSPTRRAAPASPPPPPPVTVTVEHVVLSVERRYEELVDQLPAFVRRFADSLSAAVFSPRGASAPLTRAAAEMSSISSRGPSSCTENDNRPPRHKGPGSGGLGESPPPSPAGSSSDRGGGGSKACCFCWCCCCSCSCLTVKNGDENKNQSKETRLDNIPDKDEPPSLEDIKSWSESFDKLMSSSGRKVFREFLRSEYSEENMLFWLACEDLKRTENPELVEEKARLIYEDYISILSPKEVSLDSRVREIINRNMVKPTPHTFDEAQLQIYTLMHRDSYPRFLNSQLYKGLLQ